MGSDALRHLIAALLGLALVAFGSVPCARAAWQDPLLQASGIRYPEGFDVNTVGELRGAADQLAMPEEGPVRFRLLSQGDAYTVLASPRWFWGDLRVVLPEASDVIVRGSKTLGVDGKMYVIAQEIRIPATGKAFVLRDRRGGPLWTGSATSGGGASAGPRRMMGPMGGGLMGIGGGMGHMGRR